MKLRTHIKSRLSSLILCQLTQNSCRMNSENSRHVHRTRKVETCDEDEATFVLVPQSQKMRIRVWDEVGVVQPQKSEVKFFFIILLYVKDTVMKAPLRENRFRLCGGWRVELRGWSRTVSVVGDRGETGCNVIFCHPSCLSRWNSGEGKRPLAVSRRMDECSEVVVEGKDKGERESYREYEWSYGEGKRPLAVSGAGVGDGPEVDGLKQSKDWGERVVYRRRKRRKTMSEQKQNMKWPNCPQKVSGKAILRQHYAFIIKDYLLDSYLNLKGRKKSWMHQLKSNQVYTVAGYYSTTRPLGPFNINKLHIRGKQITRVTRLALQLKKQKQNVTDHG